MADAAGTTRGPIRRADARDERQGLGASAVVDGQGQVLGIFTDGDLRRRIEAGADLRNATAQQIMHPARAALPWTPSRSMPPN